MVIHLHIGRHKTGTSSIQHCLARNRQALLQRGFWYPPAVPKGVAHHGIALALKPGGGNEPAPPLVSRFLGDISRYQDVIVSSESFQNLPPLVVSRHFPIESTRIIVYIREQLDYLVSSYSQMIQAQARTETLAEYADNAFTVDYEVFLGKWAHIYGPKNIIVGVFQRECLLNGDVVADFLSRVGITDLSGLNVEEQDRNPSIGWNLVEFKRRLNLLIPAEEHASLNIYKVFEKLAGKSERFRVKPRLSPEFCSAFRQRFASSNETVFQQYGLAPGQFALRSFSAGIGIHEWARDFPEMMKALSEVAPRLSHRVTRALEGRDIASLLPDALL